MKRILGISWAVLTLSLFCNCQKNAILYQDAFVYITAGNAGDFNENSSVPSSLDNQIRVYNVHLCSPMPESTVSVQFEVIPGDGLSEGIDYKVETSGSRLRFAPGVFDKIIQIRYYKHQVDEAKDNSLTIRLTGSDNGITIGMPGPAHKNSKHIITKFN